MAILEQFECANCGHTGPLDEHGGCECCQSRQVISLDQAEALYFRTLQQLVHRTLPNRAIAS